MNPTPRQPFRQGFGVSAGKLNAMYGAIAHARGTNGITVRMENGGMVFEWLAPDHLTDHPFKIRAVQNAELTAHIITIFFGQVNNTTPRFWGTVGDPLEVADPPEYTLANTAGTHIFYLVIEVTKDGVFDDVYIESDTALPADVVPVPDDMPDAGDTGTAGTYHFQIGSVELVDTSGSFSAVISQTITNSLTYWTCDETGRIVSV